MNCYYCKKPVEQPGKYVCNSCLEESARAAEVRETKALTVACPSCHAITGQACFSGSGVKRSYAHATRHKLAEKKSLNAEVEDVQTP